MEKLLTSSIVFICLVASCFAEQSLASTWSTCSFRDNECIVGQWQSAVKNLASGSEELKLAPMDPLKIDNIDVDVPGLVYLHFDGYMRGLKGCIFDTARTTMKKGQFKVALDLHCNVSLKGHYNVTTNTTVLFGNGYNGMDFKADGIGKVKLDNLSFKFLMDFGIIKGEDGVVKFALKEGPIGYRYKIGGPVQFGASNIYLGNEDITNLVVPFINQNWRFVMDVFGDFFFQRAMEIISELPRAVINAVPASAFFIEDMEQYLLD